MISKIVKKTIGNVCVNISQASLIAIILTDNSNKILLSVTALGMMILGIYFLNSADKAEETLARLRGTKRTFRFPRNTTFAVEEIK